MIAKIDEAVYLLISIIMLGLICLVIPGIVLSIRYALLDSAVILEGAGVSKSMQRSAKLTRGTKREILVVMTVLSLGFAALSALLYLPLTLVADLNTMLVVVAVECVLDIAGLVFTIAAFLFYWEAREKELGSGELAAGTAPQPEGTADAMARLGEIPDDDNPYSSPRF